MNILNWKAYNANHFCIQKKYNSLYYQYQNSTYLFLDSFFNEIHFIANNMNYFLHKILYFSSSSVNIKNNTPASKLAGVLLNIRHILFHFNIRYIQLFIPTYLN